jgi:hypothetical protein
VGTNSSFALNNVQASNAGPYSVIVSSSYGAATSATAVLSVTNPVCAASPTGLVGWWQAEGDAVEAMTGMAGSLTTNATFAAGKVGQAFSFNGSGAAVSFSNSAAWQLQDLTIEAWIKRVDTALVSPLAGRDGLFFSYGTGGYSFGLDASGHPLLNQVDDGRVIASPAITDTNFHHVAMTKSGTNVVFYVDGLAYPAPSFGSTFVFSTLAAIGARGDTLANSFLGSIDELSIYNRSLSAAEVRGVYFASSQGKCAYPLSWIQQPTNQSTTLGSNATFSAAVSGSRPVTYQWYLNGAGLNTATNPTLVLTGVTFFQAGNFRLSASNAAGFLLSSNAKLTVLSGPLLTNGSFETGSAGWVFNDIASPLSPLAIHGAGFNDGFGFFSSAPTDGSFCLTHGFDGNGPGRIRAAVDVYLPPSPVTLSFTYRAAWDMLNYSGSTKPRIFEVVIEPYGGGIGLQTNTILTALPGTATYDTGNLSASVDLSAFSNQGIRISFDAIIPESFTGPGFFQLDNVVLSYPPTPPLLIAKSGTNVVLSWPVAFSNFTALAASTLSSPITWTPIPTNLIVRSATNASLTVPLAPPAKYFRLRSF